MPVYTYKWAHTEPFTSMAVGGMPPDRARTIVGGVLTPAIDWERELRDNDDAENDPDWYPNGAVTDPADLIGVQNGGASGASSGGAGLLLSDSNAFERYVGGDLIPGWPRVLYGATWANIGWNPQVKGTVAASVSVSAGRYVDLSGGIREVGTYFYAEDMEAWTSLSTDTFTLVYREIWGVGRYDPFDNNRWKWASGVDVPLYDTIPRITAYHDVRIPFRFRAGTCHRAEIVVGSAHRAKISGGPAFKLDSLYSALDEDIELWDRNTLLPYPAPLLGNIPLRPGYSWRYYSHALAPGPTYHGTAGLGDLAWERPHDLVAIDCVTGERIGNYADAEAGDYFIQFRQVEYDWDAASLVYSSKPWTDPVWGMGGGVPTMTIWDWWGYNKKLIFESEPVWLDRVAMLSGTSTELSVVLQELSSEPSGYRKLAARRGSSGGTEVVLGSSAIISAPSEPWESQSSSAAGSAVIARGEQTGYLSRSAEIEGFPQNTYVDNTGWTVEGTFDPFRTDVAESPVVFSSKLWLDDFYINLSQGERATNVLQTWESTTLRADGDPDSEEFVVRWLSEGGHPESAVIVAKHSGFCPKLAQLPDGSLVAFYDTGTSVCMARLRRSRVEGKGGVPDNEDALEGAETLFEGYDSPAVCVDYRNGVIHLVVHKSASLYYVRGVIDVRASTIVWEDGGTGAPQYEIASSADKTSAITLLPGGCLLCVYFDTSGGVQQAVTRDGGQTWSVWS